MIYTLVQSGTNINSFSETKAVKTVIGKGSDLNNVVALQGRAKRKMITQKTMLSLVDIAKGLGEDEKIKSYWNTYYCQNNLTSSGEKFYGRYCKNRFCNLCNSIRKATILNAYLPTVRTWQDPYFVTLTTTACVAKDLRKILEAVLRAFTKIKNKYRKRNLRGTGLKLAGIKSLECNFNPLKQTYNPHLHLIVEDYEMAKILQNEWLLIWNSDGVKRTNGAGQHARPVKKNREQDLIEIVKYGTKIFTTPDIDKKAKKKVSPFIYTKAFHNIFKAMKGLRIFERFGFDLPKKERIRGGTKRYIIDFKEWIFDAKKADWINVENDELLTGYELPSELAQLLECNINSDTS